MLTQQILINAIVLGAVFTLFALGLSLAWGALDVLNLSHGSIFVAGAWAASRVASTFQASFANSVLAAMIAGASIAMLLDLIAFRPIRRFIRNKRQVELSMVASTVGVGFILDSLIGKVTHDQVFSFPSTSFAFRQYELGFVTISNIEMIIVGASSLVAILMNAWIKYSSQGMAIRAIAFSPTIPSVLGIRVNYMAAMTMAVSGALAGLAGVLLEVWVSGMAVSTGHSFLLKAFAIVVLGGVGSVSGCVLAAYILAFVETAIVAYGSGSLRDVAAFALIIVILLFRPQGLFGVGRAVRA